MKSSEILGRVHSIQSLGTLDGPGVRFVVFMQGCPLRCGCCHNPDTWEMGGGTLYRAEELANKCERYREYFGESGGITVSGGEPLLQADFVAELFAECKKRGINTCLDTSGSIINESTERLLQYTDRVLLDIKYPNDEDYREYVGCSIEKPLDFLECLEKANIPTVLRQVVIPTLNDGDLSIDFLSQLKETHSCVEKIELLPFKKLCAVKYDKLGIKFRFENIPEPTAEEMEIIQADLAAKQNKFPKRKPTRLKDFDYNSNGTYFITICTANRRKILSNIVGGDVLDAPNNVELLPFGKIADKYINQLSNFNDDVKVDQYVIMPNHIHIMLVVLDGGASRTSPPTKQHAAVSQFVSTFKRFCNKEYGQNIWQRHFNDHIIRNSKDFEKHTQYIRENPARWVYDDLYRE